LRVGLVNLARGLALDDTTVRCTVESIAESVILGARLDVGAATDISQSGEGNTDDC